MEKVAQDFHDQMETVFDEVKAKGKEKAKAQEGITESQKLAHGLDTSISKEELLAIGQSYANVPEDFEIHQRVKSVAKKRVDSVENGGIDWAWGELIAFGSLAGEGKLVRIAGEDTRRGTFTQRHAVLFDPHTGKEFSPLDAYARSRGNGGKFLAYNSSLSEYAGMGFEYGYSVGNPDAVVAWEGQFGDFANGAQTIIDEYVSSGEAKWGQLSKVILLLPHGYEGQGPDHSSARIERYLQLCAEGSMTLAQPSEPANYFHLLRRHALGEMRRPLIVFTPKSMLRNKMAVSKPEDFTDVKKFRSVINDPRFVDVDGNVTGEVDKIKKVILCSGKVYWDLEKERQKREIEDIAIVRIEMLHPIPYSRIREALEVFPNYEELRYVQDEPANQGAWPFMQLHLPELIEDLPKMRRISRRAQSSTATGVAKVHQFEQKELIDEALS